MWQSTLARLKLRTEEEEIEEEIEEEEEIGEDEEEMNVDRH